MRGGGGILYMRPPIRRKSGEAEKMQINETFRVPSDTPMPGNDSKTRQMPPKELKVLFSVHLYT